MHPINEGKKCRKKNSKEKQICHNWFCPGMNVLEFQNIVFGFFYKLFETLICLLIIFPDMKQKLVDFINTDEEINTLKEDIKECKGIS